MMHDINTLEPKNIPAFQVAWESTLKCNLDCSYCGDGHDNSSSHPSLEDSLKTVDFILNYLDLYMTIKPKNNKLANLNIQGGESLFHPNIIEIIEYIRYKKETFVDWKLDVSLITNAVIGKASWKKIVELIDYFTISYHPEMLLKQELMFKENVLYAHSVNQSYQVAILMHPKYWDKCISMIEWCKQNSIKYISRQIDHHWMDMRFNYTSDQAEFLTGTPKTSPIESVIKIFKKGLDLSSYGRSCCSGQCLVQNQSTETSYVKGNKFKNWSCSVNEFFLYIKQNTGDVFTNKDCKMNFYGEVGPIGNLKKSDTILQELKTMITSNNLPTIICKKSSCWCGLCATKANDTSTYNTLIKRYRA
jgi:organic radical activating enzyme